MHGFLDQLLDPNILLTVADWFRFVEQITITERHTINVKKRINDFFPYRETIRYDGRFLCDQGEEVVCNGQWLCDGGVQCARFKNAAGTITETIYKSIFCGGSFICDGRVDCSGYEKIAAEGALPLPIVPSDAASDQCKTVVTINVMADTAAITDFFLLAVTKLLRCDGSKTPSCSLCDGSIVCDGSYTGFNGRYYREDIFQEVL